MNRKTLEIVLAVAILPLILLPLMAHWDQNDNHQNLANHNYGKNLLNTLEPHSIFMTEGGDNQVFTSAYNQMAEFLRPDVRIYDQKGNVFYRIYGDFRYMFAQEVSIKRDVVDYEIFHRGRPVYLTWERKPNVGVCGDWFLKRYGLLYKVTPLKYKILEPLAARVELPYAEVAERIRGYFKNPGVLNKLKKNRGMIEKWYANRIEKGRVQQAGANNSGAFFINEEEKERLQTTLPKYREYIEAYLNREIDRAFIRELLAELEAEGYLEVRGNTVRFIKDIPSPFPGADYWKRYKFAYRKVENAEDWDYLTREILTNYNFYLATYASDKQSFYRKRLEYYRRKLGTLQGQARALMEEKIQEAKKQLANWKKMEQECYDNAVKYGYDMTPIHHNLGVIYSQRGQKQKALEAFRMGMEADKYSFATMNSYVYLLLEQATASRDPKKERQALREAREICQGVYKRIQYYKSQPEGGYKQRNEYKRFKNIEQSMIAPREQIGMDQVLKAEQAYKKDRQNKQNFSRLMMVFRKRHDYAEIIKLFENAPEYRWTFEPMLAYYYADSKRVLGDQNGAKQALENLVNLHPDFFIGWNMLGQLYQQVDKDMNAAARAYRNIVNLDAGRIQEKYSKYGKNIGQIYQNQKQAAQKFLDQYQQLQRN